MKSTVATWEKRNLNLDTIEIEIGDFDKLDDIINFIKSLNNEFIVVKVPPNRSDLIYPLQDINFNFDEIIYNCKYNNSNKLPTLKPVELKYLKKMTYSKMNNDEINNLFVEVKKGMFKTDRIAINPFFGYETASKRYKGLIKDEIDRGCSVYNLNYKEEPVGFFIFNDSIEYSKSNLAGIYSKYQGLGFGLFLNYFQILCSTNLSIKEHRTSYSSNNTGADKIHKRLGFEINDYFTIFSKIQIN